MKNLFICLGILLCLLLCCSPYTHAQCLSAPAAPACNGTEPLVTDGETLNSGTTKWYYGATTTYNMLTLKGGTLIVCGNLTIDKFYMDSGKIYVRPGGRFVIGNGEGAGLVFRGNCALYNYGILEILRNLSLEGGWASASEPNLIINASSTAQFKMNNQYFVINNAHSWFVNKGKAYFHGIITDPQSSARCVCLAKGTETKMTVLYNKVKNSFYAPEPSACVSVSEFSQLWDTLSTLNPYITMCLGLTHRTDSTCRPWGCKPVWGSAVLFRGCVSCGSIQLLPTRFTSFDAEQHPDGNALYWQIENISATGRFYIELSDDGHSFNTLSSFAVSDTRNTARYAWFDAVIRTGIHYYRVVYTDTLTNSVVYSPVVRAIQKPASSFRVYPNPFRDRLYVSLTESNTSLRAALYQADGTRQTELRVSRSGNQWELGVPPNLPPGIYFLSLSAGGRTRVEKLIKQR